MDLLEQLYKSAPLYRELFKEQLEFVLLPSRFSAALCSSRAGKTTVCAIAGIQELLHYPKSLGYYMALTKESVRDIFLPTVLPILKKYKIKYEMSGNKIMLSNGSALVMTGADHPRVVETFRGLKLRFCIIDEAASFNQKILQYLIDEVIMLRLADLEGKLMLIGTPAHHCSGLFYEVTAGKVPGWDVMKWSAFDNPHVKEQFKRLTQKFFEMKQCNETHPKYRREFLGEWCADEGNLLLKWPKFIDPPVYDVSTCRSVIGIDFGFNDETVFSVLGWEGNNKTTYVYESYGKSGMSVTDIANVLRQLHYKYRPIVVVADPAGSGKILIEEFARTQGIGIKPSQKNNKADYVEILNDAIIQGRLVLNKHTTKKLQEQIKSVVWNEERTREHEGKECDHIDALLYAFRESLAFLEKIKEPPVHKTEREINRDMIERQLRIDREEKQREYGYTRELRHIIEETNFLM